MNKELFKIALKYIQKGYSSEALLYGDDLYDETPENIELCREYYDKIEENGTKWAVEQLTKE